MKKFPVISENSNEYLARMEYRSFGFFFVDVCESYIGLFGKKRYRTLTTEMYSESKHDYDYVKIAKLAVESYEERAAENTRREMLREHNVKKFEEWDGDCR